LQGEKDDSTPARSYRKDEGVAGELNLKDYVGRRLHRNSDNPHAHIVMRNSAIRRGGIKKRK